METSTERRLQSACVLYMQEPFRVLKYGLFFGATLATSWFRSTCPVCWSWSCPGSRSGSTLTPVQRECPSAYWRAKRRLCLTDCDPSPPLTLNHEIHRPTDRVDHDHSVDGRQLVDATRVVHQSYRRLDVDVFTVRVRRSARVRRRQRPSSASRPAHPALDAAASVRRAECAAAAAAYAAQGPREPVWPGLHSRQRIHCIIYTGPTPGGA